MAVKSLFLSDSFFAVVFFSSKFRWDEDFDCDDDVHGMPGKRDGMLRIQSFVTERLQKICMNCY